MEIVSTSVRRVGAQVLNRPLSLFGRSSVNSDQLAIQEVVRQDSYGLTVLKYYGFEPRIVVDIGANIGAFSALAAHLWPESRIIAVEPDLDSAELIKYNAPNSETVAKAICYAAPNVQLYKSAKYPMCNGIDHGFAAVYRTINHWAEFSTVETVPAIAIESLAAEISFLKLDCEGSEWEILENLKCRPAVIVGEWHGFSGDTRIRSLLGDLGYSVQLGKTYGRSGLFEAKLSDDTHKAADGAFAAHIRNVPKQADMDGSGGSLPTP